MSQEDKVTLANVPAFFGVLFAQFCSLYAKTVIRKVASLTMYAFV